MMPMTTDEPSAAPEVPQALLVRVRSEFLEMPGLRLTLRQAARLWGLEGAMSEHLLTRLVESGFLRRTRDGAYMRRSMP